MSIDYNLLNTIKANYINNNVAEDKATVISDLQSIMSKELEDNLIDEYQVKVGMPQYNKTVIKNYTIPIPNCVIKQERYKEKIYNLNSRTLLSPKNSMATGDYITINEDGVNETYVVRARVDKKKTHDNTFLLHCPYEIKILDDDGIATHTYGLSFSDNKSRPGISERSETGVTENSTFQAYIRHDEISRRFIDVTGITASGKSNKISRILIDGLAYKVEGSDPASMEGLITLGLSLTSKSPDDNLELGIADYYNNVAPTPEPPTDLTIEGYPDICIGDTNDYTIVTNNVVTWGLTDNGQGVTLILGTNGKCQVKCDYNLSLIGKIVTLTAYLDYGAEITKNIEIISLA